MAASKKTTKKKQNIRKKTVKKKTQTTKKPDSNRLQAMAQWQKKGSDRLSQIMSLVQKDPKFGRTFLKDLRRKDLVLRLGVQMVGEDEMKEMNSHYRAKESATDILSFVSPQVFWAHGHLGELVICFPVLKQQAALFDHPIKTELDVLLVHGILHVFGLDHEIGAKEAEEMEGWEAYLLSLVWNEDPPTRLARRTARFAKKKKPGKGLISRSKS